MTDDEMKTLLLRVDARTERMDEQLRAMDEKLEQVHHTLYTGNGQPPLTVTVARLDERTSVLEGARQQTLGDRWLKAGVLVSSIGLGVTAIVELAKLLG